MSLLAGISVVVVELSDPLEVPKLLLSGGEEGVWMIMFFSHQHEEKRKRFFIFYAYKGERRWVLV